MEFRKANKRDLEEVWDLLLRVRKNMEDRSLFMWNDRYPSKELFKEDIDNDALYVYVDNGAIMASIAVSFDIIDEFFDYSKSKEKEALLLKTCEAKADEKPVILHRLMVDPSSQGKGIGTKILSAVKEAYPNHLMIFASYPKNDMANNLYKRLGYHNDGVYPFEYEGEWLLFHAHF